MPSPAATSQLLISFSILRDDIDMWFERRVGRVGRYIGGEIHVPAWETESPANSINWSSEKAPMDMRSLSSAAAFFADIVFGKS